MKNRKLFIVEGIVENKITKVQEKKTHPIWARNEFQAKSIFQSYYEYESYDYKCEYDLINVYEELDESAFDRKNQREDIL